MSKGYRKYCLACYSSTAAANREAYSQHKAAWLSEVLSDPMLEPGKSKSKDTNIEYLFED